MLIMQLFNIQLFIIKIKLCLSRNNENTRYDLLLISRRFTCFYLTSKIAVGESVSNAEVRISENTAKQNKVLIWRIRNKKY